MGTNGITHYVLTLKRIRIDLKGKGYAKINLWKAGTDFGHAQCKIEMEQ